MKIYFRPLTLIIFLLTTLSVIAQPNLKYTSGIRAIHQDRNNHYWFASHQEGVCRLDENGYTYYTTADGLAGNQVRTIQEDSDGTLWFGTANGVSSYADGKLTTHPVRSDLVPYRIDLYTPPGPEDYWFNAGHRPGVYHRYGETLRYLRFPPDEAGKPSAFGVTGIARDIRGQQVWIATYGAVLAYDGRHFRVLDNDYFCELTTHGPLHVRSILLDSRGDLWIGNNGIGVLRGRDGDFVNFSEQQGLTHALSDFRGGTSPPGTLQHVFAITEDRHGHLWFGDRDTGAWHYDGTTMTNYCVDEQLESPMIWQIYEDRAGRLLFAMASGGVYEFVEGNFVRRY